MPDPKATSSGNFPGWLIVALLLPLLGLIIGFVIVSRGHELASGELQTGGRVLHVTSVLGLPCAIAASLRYQRYGPLYLAGSIVMLLINLALALCLIPVWSIYAP